VYRHDPRGDAEGEPGEETVMAQVIDFHHTSDMSMKPSWDDLQLAHIDLHFHAGRQRRPYSLADVVDYARATGRRILGLTDHSWFYSNPPERSEFLHYTGDFSGFAHFAADVREVRAKFPDMVIPFGPEIRFPHIISGTCNALFDLPEVDYFLGEPYGVDDVSTVGDQLLSGMEHMVGLRDRVDRPCLLAHPLRAVVNYYVGGYGPGPKYPKHSAYPPLDQYDDPVAHVEELFGIRIRDLADASMKYDIPLEINESSWRLIHAQNQEWFVERYLFFYRTILDMGVEVSLGSDLHNVESPPCTPFTVARMLGVTPCDMRFLRHWL
jgi:hypothetical protein